MAKESREILAPLDVPAGVKRLLVAAAKREQMSMSAWRRRALAKALGYRAKKETR